MSLPPFLRDGGDLRLREVVARGGQRWWWTSGAASALDRGLAAALGRRWPGRALAARLAYLRRPRRAHWLASAEAFVRRSGLVPQDFVAQLGTPGHFRKWAATLLDGEGGTRAILKASCAPASRASIAAEMRALDALCGRLPGAVPRPLGLHEEGAETLALQAPVRGRASRQWSDAHGEFCRAMMRALTDSPRSWPAALAWREALRERFAALAGSAAGIASTCGQLLDLAEPVTRDLPLGWCHRDFTPANVWLARDGLAVIDWEWADPAWAPGHDLIQFHLLRPLRRGDAVAAQATAAELAQPGSALDRYCHALGIPFRAEVLLALHLYDLILFYADADDAGPERAAAHPLVAAAVELASRLVAAPRASRRTSSKVETPRQGRTCAETGR
jgi:hypothetical protein